MDATKGPIRPTRRAIVGALLAPGLAGLAGCSPEHDWREIRSEEAAVVVMLPAKPARLTRAINLDGLRIDMTMIGAEVRGVSYTVGAIELPDDADATRERALAAMRVAMVRNIGGAERASRSVTVARIDPGGGARGTIGGVEIEAGGRMRDREVTLLGRFVGVGRHAWQAVVLGDRPERELAAQFLESLKVMR
jgi:hypothetical protein